MYKKTKVIERLSDEPEMWVEIDAYFPPKKTRFVPGVVVRRERAQFETAFQEEIGGRD